MAVSLANYPQTSETSNLSEYDDETVSLVSFLPSHTKQPLPRLPIFETVIPQQNGSVTNKNIPSFNKRNSFPRSLPRNPSSTNRHSMCGDLPSQQTNRNSINKSSVKMRRRAASFATTDIKNNYTTSLIIQIPSKVDKVESPRSFSRSPNPSPEEKSSPKGKSCTENSTKPATTQNHHIEQKQELLDNNKVETSNNNQNQNEKDFDESSSLDKGHSRTISDDYTKNQNNHIENPQLISNNNSNSNLISQNSKPQSHNRSFFRHNITLNHQASGSSTDLRKSIYKEPSFKKRLRKVFSLTNIRQDNNNNSSNTNSTLSSVSNHKFSSLRGEKHNFTVDNDDNSSNNDKDDDTSVSSVSSNNDNVPVTTQDINNYNKSGSRRRSFIGLFSSKNEKKRNKQNRHQMQQQRHLEQQQSSLDQQNKQLDDNKSNDSTDEIKGDDNNEEKQQNENGNERVDDDPDKKSPIPSQLSSSQSLDNDSPNQFKQKNSTSPLCNQFRINKSSTRPSSLPAPAKDKEPPSSTITPRRLSVPAPLSIIKSDKSDNNQPKQPFVNLGANGTRSVPSLVLLRDTDIPPAPSTPSSIKKLQFSSKLLIHETWTREDYDRRGDQSTCNKLTPLLAQKIKEELNEYKTSEMQVHEDSKNNTHYFA
ncbi:dihydroflavonal-4-reductase protein [Rhizophagus clarus]|uniref:Dihydroflavonal-4-reductase protein n=1 Tax=Rhizophagus clarus TaxID=94130 RepID=A0A8H3KX57_9GLOM|nr:dihydroflavonal-4-reductase protein [Rhizophagus clarus]